MHFRIRPAAIQVLKSTYDPNSKKTSNKIVAKIPRATLRVKEVKEGGSLSNQEKAEIEAFIERYKNTEALQWRFYAHKLPDIVCDVVRYLSTLEDAAEKEVIAAHIAQAMVELRRAIRAVQ
jgi:hypothetical protein